MLNTHMNTAPSQYSNNDASGRDSLTLSIRLNPDSARTF